MAGHSKWANIKHKKARADAKKGKLFSQIIKEIQSAVRTGGNDPKSNARLRLSLHKARSVNIPNDTVERNIAKAFGTEKVAVDEVMYEIYGFGGVGIICAGTTESRNRAASGVRGAVSARGGNLASPNGVLFNFAKKGLLVSPLNEEGDFEKIFELASKQNAEDVSDGEGCCFITVEPQNLGMFVDIFTDNNIPLSSFDVHWLPVAEIECSEDHVRLNNRLIETLEDLEDIDQVFHNMKGCHF